MSSKRKEIKINDFKTVLKEYTKIKDKAVESDFDVDIFIDIFKNILGCAESTETIPEYVPNEDKLCEDYSLEDIPFIIKENPDKYNLRYNKKFFRKGYYTYYDKKLILKPIGVEYLYHDTRIVKNTNGSYHLYIKVATHFGHVEYDNLTPANFLMALYLNIKEDIKEQKIENKNITSVNKICKLLRENTL